MGHYAQVWVAGREVRLDLVDRVGVFAQAQGLIAPGSGVGVALSGGLDSTVLLDVVLELSARWSLKVEVFHLNYRLRGAESERDELHVRRLCEGLEVPLEVQSPPAGWRSRPEGSVQREARELRLAALEAWSRRRGLDVVALGHHRDDQAETVLTRALRGTSLRGLAAMAPRRGVFVRPLLECPRSELARWAAARGLRWVEDSSNLSPRYERNRVRHHLLPLARQEINPRADEALCQLARRAAEDEAFIQGCLEGWWQAHGDPRPGHEAVRLTALRQAPPSLRSRALLRLVGGGRISAEQLAALEDFALAPEAGTYPLRGGALLREAGWLRRVEGEPSLAPGVYASLSAPGLVSLSWAGLLLRVSPPQAPPPSVGAGGVRCWLDAAVLATGLRVRPPRPGDRLHPLGAPGSKKLSDLLVDLKVARSERPRIPVVCCGDEIVWVAGLRTCEGGKLTPETRAAVELSLETRDGALFGGWPRGETVTNDIHRAR